MKFRAIDDTGDWTFGSGIQSYGQNNLAIKYDIETKLRTFLTECFFDPEVGVPWFQILGAKDKHALILTLKQVISNVEGITAVTELSFAINAERNATIKYGVATIYTEQLTGEVAA